MTKIEELEQKLNECQKALAELKESKKEGKWKPKQGERFWFRDIDGDIVYTAYGNTNDVHNWRLSNLPIFPTEEQCERYWHFMDTVKEKSYEFSKEEWEDEQITKISIYYDYTLEKMNMVTNYCERRLNTFYFKTEEDAQYIIDNFKDELMEFFIKER
ncbi:MAG: hypothetical protein IKK84_00350 [Clostridia bacterium]|nr:hypothetical protein [Clostridia bacterium]